MIIRAGGLIVSVGHDPKLLAALPIAKWVLEIGPQHSELVVKCTQKHPQAVWLLANPNIATLVTVEGLFDLVVMSAGLPIPEVLHSVSIRVARGGILVVAIDNAASWASLAQLIEADVDAGWMPTLPDQHVGLPPSDALAAAMAPLADALSVLRRTADRTLGMARSTVQAVRGFDDAPRRAGQALFAFVAPTTRETQLRANVERSPGLQEVNAQGSSIAAHAVRPKHCRSRSRTATATGCCSVIKTCISPGASANSSTPFWPKLLPMHVPVHCSASSAWALTGPRSPATRRAS